MMNTALLFPRAQQKCREACLRFKKQTILFPKSSNYYYCIEMSVFVLLLEAIHLLLLLFLDIINQLWQSVGVI